METYLETLRSQARDILRAILSNPECQENLAPRLEEIEAAIASVEASLA